MNLPAAVAVCLSTSNCACNSLIVLVASSDPSESTAIGVPHDGQLCMMLAALALRVDGTGSEGCCSSTDMS